MSVFNTLSIKHIYSNPYYPKGKSRIENIHNFLKCTIAKFTYGSQLELDDALPLATYCYNITPLVDDLESHSFLVYGRDLIDGRVSNLQNYCRYLGNQTGQVAVQELRKLWELHAKLLTENPVTEPTNDKKVTKASNLKIGELVFVKDHCKGTFDSSYIYDHRVPGIVNESMVVLTTPDGKEKRCNIHHIKPITALQALASPFQQFQDSIQKDPGSTPPNHSYNLHSKAVKQ